MKALGPEVRYTKGLQASRKKKSWERYTRNPQLLGRKFLALEMKGIRVYYSISRYTALYSNVV